MKAIKKAAAITVAAITALGAAAVSSFAAGEEDTYKMYVQTESASVGDTVSVSVAIDANGELGVGGVSFILNFDPEELEVQTESIQAGSALDNWMGDIDTSKTEQGTIGFAYTTISKGISGEATELLNLSFKVLKVNSELTLDNADINADDFDGTNLTDKLTVLGSTVKCSHKNSETKTEITDCEQGGKAVTVCKDCGETVKTEDIAPTDHTVDKWTEIQKATCIEKGKEEGICSVCGKTVTRETDMIDHSFGEWTVTTPATCTEKGVETRTCSVCKATETREVDALGHDFGDWQTTKEPTCTETGEKERSCTRCDEKETEEIAALGHDFGDWQTTKESTCTEAGTKERACTRCDVKETEEIAALGHTWGEWSVTKEATETETGVEERTCTVCGEKETRETPVLQPTLTEPQPTEPSNTTAPPANGSQDKIPDTGYPFAGLAVVLLAAAGTAAAITIKKRK